MGEAGRQNPAGFRSAFAVGEFRALFAAQLVSIAGDQLARVALSVLVFDRTGSAAWTAVTFALTFLPDLVSGPLLSGIADRRPRRQVMVAGDVIRTVLVAALIPAASPLWLVGLLVAAVQLFKNPWGSARAALMPQILGRDRYLAGQALFNMTTQSAQLIGFATGGLIVAALGPHGALAVDAATFAASAALVRWGVHHRDAPSRTDDGDQAMTPSWWRQMTTGLVTVWGTLRLRSLVALASVSGISIAAEALAAPYAAGINAGPVAVGLLFATGPLGMVIGMLFLTRVPDETRLRWMVPMAILTCIPLIGCAWRLGLLPTILLWTAGGIASAYNLTASTTFTLSVPDARRGQAFGLAQTSIQVSQGLGIVLAGLAAQAFGAHQVVAAAGVLGTIAAVGAGVWWYRSDSQPNTALAGSA